MSDRVASFPAQLIVGFQEIAHNYGLSFKPSDGPFASSIAKVLFVAYLVANGATKKLQVLAICVRSWLRKIFLCGCIIR